MRRNCNKTLVNWRVPENENETVNKGRCWKFNKHVSEDEKTKFRTQTFKKNVELLS